MVASELTTSYRRANVALRAATTRDLAKLWPALDWRRLDATYPAWLEGVRLLVQRDATRATDLSAAYVRAFRLAAGVPGEAKVVLAPPVPVEQIATVMLVTTIVPVKRATANGVPPRQAMRNAFVMSAGDASRLVLDAGRDTVRLSSVADPAVVGWQRVGTGRCDLCSLLLSRGAVYSEETASFETHGNCACSAEPVYR